MRIIHVFIEVKPEFRKEFINETVRNVEASIKEPGIARFDFLEDTEQESKFILVEVYRTPVDAAKHKETDHYQLWKKAVEQMMAVPRSRMVLSNILPDDKGWD